MNRAVIVDVGENLPTAGLDSHSKK